MYAQPMNELCVYQRTLERLMNELDQAICEDRAHAAIWECRDVRRLQSNRYPSFFSVAFDAIFNDMIAHASKILDRNLQSATFWYVFEQRKQEIRCFCDERSISLSEIEAISDALKGIRDRTHFHIDQRDVFDPEVVWTRDGGVKYSRLTAVLESLWQIVDWLYTKEYRFSFCKSDYTGDDVEPILKAVKDAGISPIIFDVP